MTTGSKVWVRKGWHDAGRSGTVLGPDVLVQQEWTPVLFDDMEDPEFFKAAGLVAYPSTPTPPQGGA